METDNFVYIKTPAKTNDSDIFVTIIKEWLRFKTWILKNVYLSSYFSELCH